MERLKGMPLDRLRDVWDSANEYIKDKPNLVAIEDLESGYPKIMTLEQRDKLIEMFEACRPKANLEIDTSKIFIFGTGGAISNIDNNKWIDFWNNYKPE